jgi:hypothetical protein
LQLACFPSKIAAKIAAASFPPFAATLPVLLNTLSAAKQSALIDEKGISRLTKLNSIIGGAALVASILGLSNNKNNCLVKTMGGNLEVSFEKVLEKNFYNIWLKGFAVMVYKSEIMLP